MLGRIFCWASGHDMEETTIPIFALLNEVHFTCRRCGDSKVVLPALPPNLTWNEITLKQLQDNKETVEADVG